MSPTRLQLASMLNSKTGWYIGNTVIMLGYFLKQISPGTRKNN